MKNLLILLVSVVLFSGCKKIIEDYEEKEFPFHFEASINDKDVKFQANNTTSSMVNTGYQQANANGSETDMFQGTIFVDPDDDGRNVLIVGVLKYFPTEPSQSEQAAMFHTGSYGYGIGSTSTSTINGAVIFYTDTNGKLWSSELGSQTGSSFNISELEAVEGVAAPAKNFRATFSCKLYDEQGNMIPVNSASIRGKLFYE
jgi:hypothetical protein